MADSEHIYIVRTNDYALQTALCRKTGISLELCRGISTDMHVSFVICLLPGRDSLLPHQLNIRFFARPTYARALQ
jgi:hypothetical protein